MVASRYRWSHDFFEHSNSTWWPYSTAIAAVVVGVVMTVALVVVPAAAVVAVTIVVNGVFITMANVRPLFGGRCVMSHAENS